MSLTIPQASQAGLFKQGYNSYDAEDGAVIRNVRHNICVLTGHSETNIIPD
jgi:hypothetical protein